MDSGFYFLIKNGVMYRVKWKMGRWMDHLKKEVDLTYSTWQYIGFLVKIEDCAHFPGLPYYCNE